MEQAAELDSSGGDDGGEDVDAEDGNDGDDASPAPSGGLSGVSVFRWVLVAVLAVVAVVVVAFAVSGPATPTDNSVAAGLARDMIDHHAQAVDMATIVQGRTQNTDIRFLATDIALTQTNQMGQMQGWLNDWNLSLGRSGKPMAWMSTIGGMGMDMGGTSSSAGGDPSMMQLRPDGLMPGMATQTQVNQLRTLPPAKADILFLELMIAHHRGGVAMAQTALAGTKERVVVNLCQTIVTSQQSEIVQMTQMLQELQKAS
jgi:uncharacterized protein (DUF305 family)